MILDLSSPQRYTVEDRRFTKRDVTRLSLRQNAVDPSRQTPRIAGLCLRRKPIVGY